MSTLDGLLDLLNQWPAWKRIRSAPDEIDALRRRVELLEASLRTRSAARDECPRCHSLTRGISENQPDAHFPDVSYDVWRCASCQYSRRVQAG